METKPKHNISSERATDLLYDGLALHDFYINGEMKLEINDGWHKEVIFENCIIEQFSGNVTHFSKPVRFVNCQFKDCQFISTYFLGGLKIDDCIFESYLDFQTGGHNKTNNPVIITNNEFREFVNFFDCWYENEVEILNNKFHGGTNLLGKPHNLSVTFDVEPTIKDNVGLLDLDHEGNI